MTSSALKLATERASDALLQRGWMVATAESCTGGLIARQLTEVGGSSAWFERGYVTYSNASKIEVLGVAAATLAERGAVSSETAVEMALGLLARSPADVVVAVTGIAGPGGGTEGKPVGTVWFAFGTRTDGVRTAVRRFDGDRQAVRDAAAVFALNQLADIAGGPAGHLA